MANLLAVLAIIALIWLWLDSARARELTTGICREACLRQGLQFLDDTVSLERIGLRWTSEGVRLWRKFQFNYSLNGQDRYTGWVVLIGTELEKFDFNLPPQAGGQRDIENQHDDTEGKVIRFPSDRRH